MRGVVRGGRLSNVKGKKRVIKRWLGLKPAAGEQFCLPPYIAVRDF